MRESYGVAKSLEQYQRDIIEHYNGLTKNKMQSEFKYEGGGQCLFE